MANKITFLNISGFTGLKFLDCSNNDITGFNFSGATNLQTFISKYNRISGDLDLKPLSGLKKVDIEGNAVKKLDFSGLSRLEDINASRNMLTGFIPSGATALINFNVSENHLRMQDLVKIKDIYTGDPDGIARMTFLNISGNVITGSVNLQDIVGTPTFALISGFIANNQIDSSWRNSGTPHYWSRIGAPPPLV